MDSRGLVGMENLSTIGSYEFRAGCTLEWIHFRLSGELKHAVVSCMIFLLEKLHCKLTLIHADSSSTSSLKLPVVPTVIYGV